MPPLVIRLLSTDEDERVLPVLVVTTTRKRSLSKSKPSADTLLINIVCESNLERSVTSAMVSHTPASPIRSMTQVAVRSVLGLVMVKSNLPLEFFSTESEGAFAVGAHHRGVFCLEALYAKVARWSR